jgi:hypothetical protein
MSPGYFRILSLPDDVLKMSPVFYPSRDDEEVLLKYPKATKIGTVFLNILKR